MGAKSPSNRATRMMKALAHPLRERLLSALFSGEASPSELARRLGEPLPNVNSHMKQLERLGAIELAYTRTKRGAVEHVYRALERPWFDNEISGQLRSEQREALSGAVLGDLFDEIHAAIRAGAFDARHDRHLSRVPMAIDEPAWQELVDLLDGVLDEVQAVITRSLQRRAEAPWTPTFRARVALMLFEPAPEESRGRPAPAGSGDELYSDEP